MAWQQVKILTNEELAESIGDTLSELDAQAVTFLDADDTPIFEPKIGEIKYWPSTQVVGLYQAEENIETVIASLKEKFGHKLFVSVDQIEDKEWEREWMDNFHPMKFGERTWICPSWLDIPDPKAVNIMLDPGLAFGTGTHPTTRLCLEWLDSQDLRGKTVVDFGCGSGILAIAALKLGAQKVIGIDIDPQALIASQDNAKRNQVDDTLQLFLPEDQPNLQVDIVIANVLAAPLKDLSSVITDFCKNNGKLVMSGVLLQQAKAVENAYKKHFCFEELASIDEWVRLSAIKQN